MYDNMSVNMIIDKRYSTYYNCKHLFIYCIDENETIILRLKSSSMYRYSAIVILDYNRSIIVPFSRAHWLIIGNNPINYRIAQGLNRLMIQCRYVNRSRASVLWSFATGFIILGSINPCDAGHCVYIRRCCHLFFSFTDEI